MQTRQVSTRFLLSSLLNQSPTLSLSLSLYMYIPPASQLAPLGVSLLISVLAYGSQILFRYIEPFSLGRRQTIVFNTLVGCIWICYGRACLVDPGYIPFEWTPSSLINDTGYGSAEERHRWCKKCESFKPPRTHHCKTCQRYQQILSLSHLCSISNTLEVDVYPKWTITAPGL